MKKGCLVAIILLVGIIVLFVHSLSTAFDPEYEKVEIKQNIGGFLICNSVYNSDHHSWQYDVSYTYKLDDGSVIDIGSGIYYGRSWNQDEQLVQYKGWTILKTGGSAGTDKLIIGDPKKKKWTEYEFTPEWIEKDPLWKSLKSNSLLNVCCSEVYIDSVSQGKIVLHYKFRTSERQFKKYEQKKIMYLIDEITGQPKMIQIE